MKFLHPKYTVIATATIMSLIMSGVISLTFSIMNGGINLDSLLMWPQSWLKAWIVALPVAIIVMPFVRKIVSNITT